MDECEDKDLGGKKTSNYQANINDILSLHYVYTIR